jgi:hypothetical protein
MAIFSDLELQGILNEAEDRSFSKKIEDRAGQAKKAIEGAKENFDKNAWYKKKQTEKKKKSSNKITFKEDANGNIVDCVFDGEDETSSINERSSIDRFNITGNHSTKDVAEKVTRDLTNKSAVEIEKERQSWQEKPGEKAGEAIADVATGGMINTAARFVGKNTGKLIDKVIDKAKKDRKAQKEAADWRDVYRSPEYDRAINEFFDITDHETRRTLLAVNEADQNKILVSLTSKLYDNVVDKIDDIDFGEIERTKGDIEKLPNFPTLTECLNTMAKLLIEFKQDTKPVDTIAECVSNIIDSKDIWTKAYALNVELPMVTYNTMVLAVIEATSYMVSMCVEFVKSPSQDTMQIMIDKSALTKSKGHMLFKNIEAFNEAYKKGQVEKAMMHVIGENASKKNFLGIGLYTSFGVGVAAVAGIAGLLFIIIPVIRELIFLFFYYRVKISEFFEVQADLLQISSYNVENNRLDLTKEERKKISAKQMKVADNFRKVARKIEVDGNTAEKSASKDIKEESNKKYKTDEVMDELPDSASSALF